MVMREVPHEKNMNLKSMQVNASKSVTRMTKTDVNKLARLVEGIKMR